MDIRQLHGCRRLLQRQLKAHRKFFCIAVALIITLGIILRWRNAGVQLYIVEEHQDVLPHWFSSVSRGIPHTLIHIDAHPDNALPEYLLGYPLFRPPRTEKELGFLLQRNDNFILAAVMSGIINRVIHIWPSWSRTEYVANYVNKTVGLGLVELPEGSGNSAFCECIQDNGNFKNCFYMDFTNLMYNKDPEIPVDRCQIHVSYQHETMDEDVALKLAIRPNWIKKSTPVILDIDEDFFGVESVFERKFGKSGLPYKHIEKIGNLTSLMFCPADKIGELDADEFFSELLDVLLKYCEWESHTKCRLSSEGKSISRGKFVSLMMNNLDIFCGTKTDKYLIFFDKLLSLFMSMSEEQVKILKSVGFCSVMSPKEGTLFEINMIDADLKPCVGRNVPGETMVALYSPKKKEIQWYLKKLHSVFTKLNLVTLKLVTIARSIRDGFTPWSHFKNIEHGLLELVTRIWPNKNIKVNYDQYLLGGAWGWPDR